MGDGVDRFGNGVSVMRPMVPTSARWPARPRLDCDNDAAGCTARAVVAHYHDGERFNYCSGCALAERERRGEPDAEERIR